MVKKPETKFQENLRDFLKTRDALVLVTIGNRYQKGFPDLYVAHVYWTGWLELKYGDGQLRPKQVERLRDLRRRKVNAYVFTKTENDMYYFSNEDDSWRSSKFLTIQTAWEWLTRERRAD